jgi:hypothetical protein
MIYQNPTSSDFTIFQDWCHSCSVSVYICHSCLNVGYVDLPTPPTPTYYFFISQCWVSQKPYIPYIPYIHYILKYKRKRKEKTENQCKNEKKT